MYWIWVCDPNSILAYVYRGMCIYIFIFPQGCVSLKLSLYVDTNRCCGERIGDEFY